MTVWHAPVPFLAVCIAMWFGMRWFQRGQFETRLANAQSTIEMLERKIAHRQADEVVAIAAASAADAPARNAPKAAVPRRQLALGETITFAEISEAYRVNVESKAREIVAPFIGSTMEASGEVVQVSEHEDHSLVSMMVGSDMVFCKFTSDRRPVGSLNKGDAITVKGTLAGASALWIDLDDCELIALSIFASFSGLSDAFAPSHLTL